MFQNARLKLTIWYLVIAGFISAAFSVTLYKMISNEIERFERMARNRIERRIVERFPFFQAPDGQIPRIPDILHDATPEILEEARHRIFLMLIGVNGIVIVLSGTLGYILAGRTLRPIQRMVDSQQRFISDASHELKTPLTSLKSAFEVFLRGKDKTIKEAEVIMKESVEEVDKLQSLSESLLTLSTFQSPHTISFHSISLDESIQKAIKIIEPKANTKHITISYIPKKIIFTGEKERCIQLWIILLDNAVKYGKVGGSIQIISKSINEKVTVSVKDNGIGIMNTDIPHIFDRFYRADSARTTSDEHGFGLGLSIAKEIVELHNGNIEVKSKIGKETEFIVTVPKRKINQH